LNGAGVRSNGRPDAGETRSSYIIFSYLSQPEASRLKILFDFSPIILRDDVHAERGRPEMNRA